MSITELPTELISAICDDLPATSLFHIRRSCRRLEQVTATRFLKRYYEQIYILVTPRNLEFLQFVANHDILRRSTRAVHIFPGLWESWKDLKVEAFDYYNGRNSHEMVPPSLAQDRLDAYRQILDEHLQLINTENLQDCLMDVFGRFPNLESVGLAHRIWNRDDLSRPEPLRCIDWLSIKRRTGQDPILLSDETFTGLQEYRSRTKVLKAMLTAVATNNISLKSSTSCSGGCQSLGSGQLESDMLSNALRDIRQLHLCWSWYVEAKKDSRCNTMGQIMKAASASVERLHWGMATEGFKTSGTRDSPYHRLVDGTQFQRLTELKMSLLLVASSTLPEILSSTISTLRRLELSQIQIERTRSAMEGSARWRRVFNLIAEHHNLDYVDLTRLGHAGIYWTLLDPVHGVEADDPLATRADHAVWDISRARIDMREWMLRVRFDIRCGDAYSTVDPGSYAFGKDVEMDEWVRSCIKE